jgi:hypothetical protein
MGGNMKVIFLDIDGVLNSFDYMHGANAVWHESDHDYDIIRDKYGQKFDPRCVLWLEWIVKKTGAKIVISSSWRMSGLRVMQDMWDLRNLPGEVIDITPDAVNAMDESRGREIQLWLDKNEVDTYCIIDDDSDMLSSQSLFFVQTKSKYGITRGEALDVVSTLNIKNDE